MQVRLVLSADGNSAQDIQGELLSLTSLSYRES